MDAVKRTHRCAIEAPRYASRQPGTDARPPGARAFTLLELLIVVALIAILTAILVIPALGSRMRGNETSTVAALRTICTQQENFRSQAVVDQDSNGLGEFGLLGELAGVTVPRREGAAVPISPRAIDSLFKTDANGFAARYGFYIQVYLPTDDAGGAGNDRDLGGDAGTPGPILTNAAGITQQQYAWCAYAWPIGENTGDRVFFIDHSGVLYQTRGDAKAYLGTTSVPAANAAYGGQAFAATPAGLEGSTGSDGNIWTVVQ